MQKRLIWIVHIYVYVLLQALSSTINVYILYAVIEIVLNVLNQVGGWVPHHAIYTYHWNWLDVYMYGKGIACIQYKGACILVMYNCYSYYNINRFPVVVLCSQAFPHIVDSRLHSYILISTTLHGYHTCTWHSSTEWWFSWWQHVAL